MFEMRLFFRDNNYHVEYGRNRRISLRTGDKETALALFNEMKTAEIRGKLLLLDKKERISISQFIKLYIKDPDRINLSPETLKNDSFAFKCLLDITGDIPLRLITKDVIKKFKEITVRRVKPVSVNTYLRHIKAGLAWAKTEEYIDKVPVIKQYKIGQALPRPINKVDIKKILIYSKKQIPEMHKIITFALFTGCRRAEIIRARYEHIQNETIRVYGKGNKEREIRLLPQALLERKDIGKIFRYQHTSTVSNYFRKIVRAVKVQARFHDLRHTAGTMMLTHGIRLEIVQEILGHADIRTTKIYAKVLSTVIHEEMDKMKGINFE